MIPTQDLSDEMIELLQRLRKSKPEDRSEKARRIAVTITEIEKVIAYYRSFVIEEWTV